MLYFSQNKCTKKTMTIFFKTQFIIPRMQTFLKPNSKYILKVVYKNIIMPEPLNLRSFLGRARVCQTVCYHFIVNKECIYVRYNYKYI